MKVEKISQLEIEGIQAIKDIQERINPKWNHSKLGTADGPLDLLRKQVRTLRDLSSARKAIYYGDEEGENYAKEFDIYNRNYDHFLIDVIFFKHFLEQPFGHVDVENYMAGLINDENRAKNFNAIIKNILIREDLLALDLNLIDQLFRIHQLANRRGKKTRERTGKKEQE